MCGHIFAPNPPEAIPEKGGRAQQLNCRLDPEDHLKIVPFLPFPFTLNMPSRGVPEQQSSVRSQKVNSEKGARSNDRSNILWQFFFGGGLVWLAVLQLHLIPTGKPSSGTDFKVPGPGWKKGGDCSLKRLVPFWGAGLFSIHLIKGSLAQLHPMTGPCSQARPW